jgi:hypothetical protein
MKALIGSRGTVGSSLLDQTEFDVVYNSDSVELMRGHSYDLVVCAAPSGFRLLINRDPESDNHNVQRLMSVLATCNIKRFILCSTVDALNYPNTPYGRNRLLLEQFAAEKFDSSIFRLSSLVGQHIKKNCLHDMRNRVYIEKINSAMQLQWNPLDQLWADIVQHWHRPVVNLVSEPIVVKEINDRFFQLGIGTAPAAEYQDIQPYLYTKQEIFAAMERYLA